MRGLLVVGGIDPTGGAGITIDTLHAHDVGVWALPVASCITVQTPERFDAAVPVDAKTFTAGLEAAAATMEIGAVKTGLLWDPLQIEYLAAFVRHLKQEDPHVRLVVDPVLRATAPGDQPPREMQRALEDRLIPIADVVTPNMEELSRLTDVQVTSIDTAHAAALKLVLLGVGAVYVKGVEHQGNTVTDLFVTRNERQAVRIARTGPDMVHGSGCAVASRIAAHLVAGRSVADACALASHEFSQLRRDARPGVPHKQGLASPFPLLADDEATPVVDELQRAVPRILSLLPAAWVAECGNNIAYAHKGATKESDVATLRQRIRLRDGRPHAPAAAHRPSTSHVARVALAAAQATHESACALNLRHIPAVFARAEAAGLTVGHFERKDQPAEQRSSVEWGTRTVLQRGYVDLVADDGGPGKEPMVRLLAKDPQDLVDKLYALVT